MEWMDADGYRLARWLFERMLAATYLIGFIAARNQFPALLGENGLTPAAPMLARAGFRLRPSLFHWRYSDRFFRLIAWLGVALSAGALAGIPASAPVWLHMLWWILLWALYLSIVNAGGRFYGFGWETMTLEAGFFAAFLGPADVAPSWITLLALRWLLFRVEFGAGLIKLRHDPCWRDLTCLYFHYETQPLPNPLSWLFHRLPKVLHRASVLFSHIVQVIVPFGLFAPQPIAGIAGGLIAYHQLWLIVSGNYSWLNWLTLILAIPAFSDGMLQPLLGGLSGLPAVAGPLSGLQDFVPRAIVPLAAIDVGARPFWLDVVLIALALLTVALSIQPTLNLLSSSQRMNFSYNPLHLVSTYGAFGSITRARYEIVIEGTYDDDPTAESEWRAYEFKAKPGDPKRMPPQIAPYHLRIDWMMWFLPLAVDVMDSRVNVRGHQTWFARLIERLLRGDEATLKLLRTNPFPDKPPSCVRARFFRYQYSSLAELRSTGAWWKRSLVGQYLHPVSLKDLER